MWCCLGVWFGWIQADAQSLGATRYWDPPVPSTRSPYHCCKRHKCKAEMSLGSRAQRSSSAAGPWHRVRNAACAPLLKPPSPFVTFTEFPSPSPSSPRLCWLLGVLKSPSPRGPAWGGHGAAPRPLVFCRGSLAALSRSRSCGHAGAGQQRAEVAEPRRVDVSRNWDSSKYFKAD